MLKKLIYLTNRFIIIRKLFEYIKLLKTIKVNNFWIYIRNQDDFNFLASFINYINNNTKLEKLKENLDKVTLEKLNITLKKIRLLTQNNILKFSDIFDNYDIENAKKFANFLKENKENQFPINSYYLSKTKKDYNFDIKWKSIIDLWACDWDSSITFSNVYPNSKVYWFEPETNNFNKFKENIEKFNKNDFVIPVQYGVANFEWVSKFQWTWAWASIWWDEWEEIKITTIDKYVFDNNLTPWMIKWDIEWLEYNSILWSEKTIKTFKPILFISIYHTGKDFFEIKPLIESWNLWYKFWIEKWHNGHPFADTVLVCY